MVVYEARLQFNNNSPLDLEAYEIWKALPVRSKKPILISIIRKLGDSDITIEDLVLGYFDITKREPAKPQIPDWKNNEQLELPLSEEDI